ncbi:MAG: hypothetical protein CBC29_06250 [Methylococcaceae bacterium TMED69]|nr:MAG: hypothetical protein CBC29_06250 [Methylococcaceae bacterium TMED69]|tara:strand:- start:1389 stop:1577 length:189 start_codon:yes stop_codon:yes gene_type:complete
MKWLKKIFGIKSPLAKKQARLKSLQEKGFQAQRNGNLSLAGKYYSEAEFLETEIIEMLESKK